MMVTVLVVEVMTMMIIMISQEWGERTTTYSLLSTIRGSTYSQEEEEKEEAHYCDSSTKGHHGMAPTRPWMEHWLWRLYSGLWSTFFTLSLSQGPMEMVKSVR